MDIHTLMDKFSELPNARIGGGLADRKSTLEFESIVSQYPFLQRDQGYIDFLKFYGGASCNWVDDKRDASINIFGFFTDVATHLLDDETPIIDADGFFAFADGGIDERLGLNSGLKVLKWLGASYDATGARTWGVYRIKMIENDAMTDYWYCETFLEWLQLIIDHKIDIPDKSG